MTTTLSYTETELVHLLKERDERVFTYIYDNYSPVIYGVILRTVSDEEMASEVLSEVFVKIWRNADQYDATKGRLYTWMVNIARNASIDKLRSKDFQYSKRISPLESFEKSGSSDTMLSMNFDHIGLEKVLQNLKKEHLVLIDLAYFKGYTQEEISKELNVPLGTVKTRIRTALTQLRTLFSKE